MQTQATGPGYLTLQEAQTQEQQRKQKIQEVKEKRSKNRSEVSKSLDQKTENTAQGKIISTSDTATQSSPRKIEKEKTSNISEVVSQEMQKEDSSVDLTKLVNDLSPNAQSSFESTLTQKQLDVAGFQSVFALGNNRYQSAQSQSQMHNEQVREQFLSLRETEKNQLKEISNLYDISKKVFDSRIAALNQAIANQSLEAAFLKHTIIGNDSYTKSYSVLNMELGYLYGAEYRLGETSKALKTRKEAIGIKEGETSNVKEVESIDLAASSIAGARPSEFSSKLVKQLHDVVALKEEVTICNEALRKDLFEIAKGSNLPREYYIYHKQRQDALKNSFTEIKQETKGQIEELDKNISLEASTPNSPKALAYKQERLELTKRLETIESRLSEIDALLGLRKKQFKLEEKGLDTKDPVQLPALSPDYQKGLDVTTRIIVLKEDIVLGNEWEYVGPIEKRRITYFNQAGQLEKLTIEKKEFETQTLPNRLKIIDSAVTTYKTWISNIQESMKAIDTHFKQLANDAQQRALWQVAPPPPKVDTLTASQTGGIFSWWGSSSKIEKTSEKKAEGKQDNMQASPSDAKAEVKDDAKAEVKADTKADTKADAKTDTKADAKKKN